MTQIYLLDIDKNNNYINLEENGYTDIIKKYVDIKINYNRKQSVIAWIALLNLLVRHLEPKDIVFGKNVFGKPFLKNNKIFFNISHSAEKIAIAISDKQIGVDIEKIAEHNLKIAKRCFVKQEEEFVFSGQTQEEIKKRFYVIWTLKESYLKYKGVGLTEKLNSFSIDLTGVMGVDSPNNPQKNKIKITSNVFNQDVDLNLNLKFFETNDYIISCCNSSQEDEIQLIDLNSEQLKRLFKNIN